MSTYLVARDLPPRRDGMVRRGQSGHHEGTFPTIPCQIRRHAQLGWHPRASGHKAPWDSQATWPRLSTECAIPVPGSQREAIASSVTGAAERHMLRAKCHAAWF